MIEVYVAPSREENLAIFAEALETMRLNAFPSLVTGPWYDRRGGTLGLHVRGSDEDLAKFRRKFEPRLKARLGEAWLRSRA